MERHDIHSALTHLQGADPDAIGRLAALFRPISLERGQLLSGPGQNGRSLYLLGEGILHHYRLDGKGKAQTLQLYLPGSFLGTPAMLLPPSERDYICAVTPSRVLTAGQTALSAHCQAHPSDAQLLLAIQQTICLAQLQLTLRQRR